MAIVAFGLARSSCRLLLGEAATKKNVVAIHQAIEAHPSVVKVVELLTMHLAPKQILVNAHVNLKSDLSNTEIVQTIIEVEEAMKKAEPKVDMIFLETVSLRDTGVKEVNPKHIG